MKSTMAAIYFTVVVLGWVNAQSYWTAKYDLSDGLPHNAVCMIFEDSKGYLWIGTVGGGVAKYDGRRFITIDETDGLLSSVVYGLDEDSKGRIWIRTPNGISRYDGSSLMSIKISDLNRYQGLSIVEYRDTTYAVFRKYGGISILHLEQDSAYNYDKQFNLGKEIRDVFEIDINTLLINSKDGDLFIKREDGVRKIGSQMIVKDFLRTEKGIFLFVDDKIYALNDNDELLQKYQGISGDWMTCSKDLSYAWTGFHFNTTEFKKIKFESSSWSYTPDTFPYDPVWVLFDSNGNEWFGSYNDGLTKRSPAQFQKLSLDKHFGSGTIQCIIQDASKNLWVGTSSGIQVLDSLNELKMVLDFRDDNRNNIRSMSSDAEGIWVATFNGLGRFKTGDFKGKWFTKSDGLLRDTIRKIVLDGEGRLWINYETEVGLSIIDDIGMARLTRQDGLKRNAVRDILYSKKYQSMFICTLTGLQQFRNGKLTDIFIPGFEDRLLMTLGLYKEDYLLVGSGGSGLVIIDLRDYSTEILTVKNGLSHNFINTFAQSDYEDNIWVNTVKGLNKVQKIGNVWKVTHFGLNNGLPNYVASRLAYHFTPELNYFGLTSGLYSYLPNDSSIRSNKNVPLHFVYVSVNKGIIPAEKILLPGEFEYDHNNILFHFNKTDNSQVGYQFQYKLDGFDNEWTIIHDATPVEYRGLRPGSYSFIVKSTDNVGNWSDQLEFHFTILPPFYQTPVFMGVVAIALLLIVWWLVHYRTRLKVRRITLIQQARIDEATKMRKEIARDFHDEMGNQIARIINYIGLIKLNGSSKAEILNRAEQTSKHLLTGTKDFVWSIDPINDNLDSLLVHIRDFGEKLLAEKGIEFRVFYNFQEKMQLPYGYTGQINLIFKEALTNVFKHSNATQVVLRFEAKIFKAIISVEDNGIGLANAHKHEGEGIANMKTRADRISALLKFEDVQPSGTQVKLIFDLKISDHEFQQKSIHR
jgi:ligand-binding sensor domain-containing protein